MPRPALPFTALMLAMLAACGDARSTSDTASGAPRADTVLPVATTDRGAARLDSAARDIVSFLQGQGALDPASLADTVELRVAPEGGGHRARVPRTVLAAPLGWQVEGGGRRHALAPSKDAGQLTTVVGQHFRCQPTALAGSAPDWASRPHVGVRLQPAGATSCLQSWNATLVFDTAATARPRLVGLLYDQWEW